MENYWPELGGADLRVGRRDRAESGRPDLEHLSGWIAPGKQQRDLRGFVGIRVGVRLDVFDGFPTTSGAYQTANNGSLGGFSDINFGGDGYVTKLDPAMGNVLFSTFIGGSDDEKIDQIVVEAALPGKITVAGAHRLHGFSDHPRCI